MQKTGWRATGRRRGWMLRAVQTGDPDVAGALLAAGFDAKFADENRVTLVMRAAEAGNAETVRLLLAAGGIRRRETAAASSMAAPRVDVLVALMAIEAARLAARVDE